MISMGAVSFAHLHKHNYPLGFKNIYEGGENIQTHKIVSSYKATTAESLLSLVVAIVL